MANSLFPHFLAHPVHDEREKNMTLNSIYDRLKSTGKLMSCRSAFSRWLELHDLVDFSRLARPTGPTNTGSS